MKSQWQPRIEPISFKYPVDFYARRRHYIDHLAPVWKALQGWTQRGHFYVPASLYDYAVSLCDSGIVPTESKNEMNEPPRGHGPLVTAAIGDVNVSSQHSWRPQLLFEHGVGIVFPNNSSYAGSLGLRRYVAKFFAPNQIVFNKTEQALPGAYQAIVGTPKLDAWEGTAPINRTKPETIAISFHWDGKDVAPEAGNALAHYKPVLKELGETFHVLGHGHPRILPELVPLWKEYGFEIVENFDDVMRRASIYINDCSSTMYEWLVTGRPVVILNAPWFNRKVHYGIRFWDYTDIGPWVNEPAELIPTIRWCFDHDEYLVKRQSTRDILYPHLGHSAKLAAAEIISFVDRIRASIR